MPWNDPGETVVAGTGQVYIAAVGTTLPTTPDADPVTAFHGLGYHSEEGLSVNKEIDITGHRVWQSKVEIRRERESEDFTLSFQLVQWNEDTIPFVMGGGSVTSLGGGDYKYTPSASTDALAEWAVVADAIDGSNHLRYIIPRGNVIEGVESTFRSNEMGQLPVSFKALQPTDGSAAWYLLTDLAGFATGS